MNFIFMLDGKDRHKEQDTEERQKKNDKAIKAVSDRQKAEQYFKERGISHDGRSIEA